MVVMKTPAVPIVAVILLLGFSGAALDTVHAFLPAPLPVSPADGHPSVPSPPIFVWEPVASARSYSLQVKTADGTNVLTASGVCASYYEAPAQRFEPAAAYSWRVGADSAANATAWSEEWSFRTAGLRSPPRRIGDMDDDGIPDREEWETLHTDPRRKTLFIRPRARVKMVGEGQFVYWEAFAELFPSGVPGMADIPPLTGAGIQVVVIGCCRNPPCSSSCHPYYPPFDRFDYDPADDPNTPHADILEVTLAMKTSADGSTGIYCSEHTRGFGHTYFDPNFATYVDDRSRTVPRWTWDIKGVTPPTPKHHGYYSPVIYPYPHDTYFREGAYERIAAEQAPRTKDCRLGGCDQLSPLNLNDEDPVPNPPFTEDPDDTVEFNPISFDEDARIVSAGASPSRYRRDDVLRRTVAHEIGHALMNASTEDHCDNPACVMFGYSIDWELAESGFGGTNDAFAAVTEARACSHAPGGELDIRRATIVHNRLHARGLVP